jgi:hypothetical protein
MSVPRPRQPQKMPVSPISRGLSSLVIIMFIQGNYPSAERWPVSRPNIRVVRDLKLRQIP